MELVYLWVEAYKNIHNQGFNFSPRFNCNYDPDTNALTIDENDDYIENFFGDNINVTAIVGKNGSGKSSIIMALKKINYFHHQEENAKFILCLKSNDKISIMSSIKNINSSYDICYVEQEKYLEHESDIEDKVSISNFYFYDLIAEDGYVEDTKRISNLAIKNSKNNFTFQLTTFMLYPKIIFLYDDEEYKDGLIHQIQPDLVATSEEQGSNYHNLLDLRPNNSLQAYMISIIVEDDLCDDFFQEYNSNNDEEIIQNYYDNYCSDDNKYNLDEYNQLTSNINYEIDKMSEENKELIRKYNKFLVFDFEDIKGRKFSDLSHGEKSIYAQFILMDNIVKNNKDILFLIDEPDLSLHPEWQRKYLNEFMSTFLNTKKGIHLILTSHSPFLLSDIPKQNIIFLDTDEEDNCKVVDGLKEKKQTFGANIHTLLSDSFFMEDGLMGEFAKGKIDKAITLLNQEHLSDEELKYCEQIISIIGEPIVKNQLQRMLDSKRLKKLDEIDAIKSSMEAMQKRLDELEK